MRNRKVCEEHQVHHVDLYIRSGMGSIESDTHDNLRQYPNMQPRGDMVICIHMSPYGYTAELPSSCTLGPRWEAIIIRSNFRSEAILGFPSPKYTGHVT